jgi:HEAT repeat protein
MKGFKIIAALSALLGLTAFWYGTEVLAQKGESQEVQKYIDSLKDSEWQIRWEAVTVLGESKDPRAIVPLIGALRGDENTYVRATAAWALGEIKDRRAIEALIAALKDESHGVKKNAALALKTITGKDFGKDPALWQEWWEKNK